MNISFLLKHYFNDTDNVNIDVFDAHTLNDVYQQVFAVLTSYFEIEVSVLQALSYCFYEILDNVHIHSGKPLGTAITHFDAKKSILRVLVADGGMGIQKSLSENKKFANISEPEALEMCLQDSVTDGKGMGFGLYATSRLINNIGIEFVLHSGNHKLIYKNGKTEIIGNGLWQGTIIYMKLTTSKDIDPNEVVDHRTNADDQYNDSFVASEELDELWTGNTGTTTFRFSEYGKDFGTRDMGARLREKIRPILTGNEKVLLDFTGVNVVSNSFADECIAKLLLEMPLDELKRHTVFCGLSAMAEKSILVALQRRFRTENKI